MLKLEAQVGCLISLKDSGMSTVAKAQIDEKRRNWIE